ncbi:MAG TPA: PDZ domain-containing protein [Gemmataceae bacterium]|nr:PDZ domain-containing protein [Gemmataceae bacterium]
MSPGPNPQVDLNLLEETRKRINAIVAQIARDSESDMPPSDYYGQFLQRVLDAVAAPAGAVWLRTPQGNLQLQYQVKMHVVGLDKSDDDRQTHDELLRMSIQMARPQMVPPHSGTGSAEDGKPAPGNPTDYVILMAPILVDKQVAGLVEVWQDADRNPQAQEGFLRFITQMAGLASTYTRNHQLRQMVGQQTLWTQLEAYTRQIHGSLNPMEVGYLIANEGRRLIECDRVSVAMRRGRKAHVEAISGADVVEKRSNLVRLMAKLFDKVLLWGEKLIYQGTKDDSLPPAVLTALDNYLAESNSKLLVILPLKDEREAESKKPPRSAMMMECFDPAAAPDQLIARLEVVGRHATSALYNAYEYRRIPMRFIWRPLAKLQDGLGGKARAIAFLVLAAVVLLIGALVFVPYPLKMEAKGQLLPKERRYVYSPREAQVVEFKVEPGQHVSAEEPLAEMYDPELHRQMIQLQSEIDGAAREVANLSAIIGKAKTPDDILSYNGQRITKENTRASKQAELEAIKRRVHAIPDKPGFFYLVSTVSGTVLTPNFREDFASKMFKPNEQILRVGDKTGRWEIEIKIKQKHIGQILQAFRGTDALGVGLQENAERGAVVAQLAPGRPAEKSGLKAGDVITGVDGKEVANAEQLRDAIRDAGTGRDVTLKLARGKETKDVRVRLEDEELDVDLILSSAPTRTFRAKLARSSIGGEATPNRDENNEAEPVVLAYVRIDGEGIDPARSLINDQYKNLLLAGTEVTAKVRCGSHAMGYSLFYGVWEWFYEKVVFWF